MDFEKIINMQKKLDDAYVKDGNLNNKFIDEKRIVAILVEIGEFANEYAPFKYWKKKVNIDKNKVLEEFVDGIHFFITIIIKLKIDIKYIKFNVLNNNKSIQLIHTFKAVSNLYKNLNKKNVLNAFEIYLGNAKILGINFEEIEEAYTKKNIINFERIKNGY